MTYQTGSPILAADFNGFLATTNAVYGVGTGDRGYGQTTIAQSSVAVGTAVLASGWTNLRNMLVVCANQQGTVFTTLPPSGDYVTGHRIEAYTTTPNLPTNVTLIDTNRLNVSGTSLGVTTGVWTVTRATSWTVSIFCEISVLWAAEDNARYYFNSGGQIRMTGHQPITTTQDSHWSTAYSLIGTLNFSAHTTTNTGIATGSHAIGYYNLTDTYQTLFDGSEGITGASYSVNELTIAAKRLNFLGARGGNGNGVQFRITLTDTGTSSGVTVSSGTNFAFDNARATTFLSGIAAPTYATVTPF